MTIQAEPASGFGQANQIVRLGLETCPGCGKGVTVVEEAPLKVQQVADLVEKPVEIWEYQRPKYHCDECGWSGYGPLPWGVKEGFSYGAKLSSVIGWLGYGGNLTWHKQIAVVELIFKVPMSQGSLAKNVFEKGGSAFIGINSIALHSGWV